MRSLTAYLVEGVELAIDLANSGSAYRRGSPRETGEAPVTSPNPEQALAAQVRAILLAEVGEAGEALNTLFGTAAAAPVLAPDETGRWRLHLHSLAADPAARQVVKIATGLATLIDDDEWSTVKQCAADRCEDLFLDRSRNSSRRFCSRTCANRVNASAHRHRRREPPPGA